MSEPSSAIFKGNPVQLPLDLFIPPDALELWLEQFEGPFDLLLYLIKKNQFDILDIPISDITKQYMDYIDHLDATHFELASDYLVMAAWLAEIKSRLLLPKDESIEEDEEFDPRQLLIERLQLYAIFKKAAVDMRELSQVDETIFIPSVHLPEFTVEKTYPTVSLDDLSNALIALLKNRSLFKTHSVTQEQLSVQEQMVSILEQLDSMTEATFEDLLTPSQSVLGIVVSFMAILELAKQQLIVISQKAAYETIFVAKMPSSLNANTIDANLEISSD